MSGYNGFESRLFNDVYSLFLRFRLANNCDAHWEQLVAEADGICKKYHKHPLARTMLGCTIQDLEAHIKHTKIGGHSVEEWNKPFINTAANYYSGIERDIFSSAYGLIVDYTRKPSGTESAEIAAQYTAQRFGNHPLAVGILEEVIKCIDARNAHKKINGHYPEEWDKIFSSGRPE